MENSSTKLNPSEVFGADKCRAALAEAASTRLGYAARRCEELEAEIITERQKIAEAKAELDRLRPPKEVPLDLTPSEVLSEP